MLVDPEIDPLLFSQKKEDAKKARFKVATSFEWIQFSPAALAQFRNKMQKKFCNANFERQRPLCWRTEVSLSVTEHKGKRHLHFMLAVIAKKQENKGI